MPFPDGVTDEPTYDGSFKALARLISNGWHSSLAKASAFLCEANSDALDMSVGIICDLTCEFSKKSEAER